MQRLRHKTALFKLCRLYLLLAALGVLLFVLKKTLGFGLVCMFHVITGLLCPACGVTRMMLAIFRGDFYSAYCLNRFLFITLPGFVFYGIKCSVQYVKLGRCFFSKRDNAVFYAFIICAVLFAIARNIDAVIHY